MGDRLRDGGLMEEHDAPARLSQVRACGAVALLVGIACWMWIDDRYVSRGQTLTWVGLAVGLVVGRAWWARALLLGYGAWTALDALVTSLRMHPAIHRGVVPSMEALREETFWLFGIAFVAHVIAVGLLAPWRRGELDRRGCALALIGFGCTGAWMMVSADVEHAGLALVLGVLAAVGVAQRARWGAVLAVISAATLAAVVTRGWWGWWDVDLSAGHGRSSLWTCLSPLACNVVGLASVGIFYLAALGGLIGGLCVWRRRDGVAAVVA